MAEIEEQANRAWKPEGGGTATAVSDFDRIVIPPILPVLNETFEALEEISEERAIPEAGPSAVYAVRWYNH